MKALWSISIQDYCEILDRAVKRGFKPGDSLEPVIAEYVREKNIKPVGGTELNKEELIKELTSHGKNVLTYDVDKNGNTKFRVDKGKKET